MRKMNKLWRHYDKLTTVERVNLLLAAQERGDEAEANALENACPTAASVHYNARMIGLGHVASLLVAQLLACQVFLIAMLPDLPEGTGAASVLRSRFRPLLEREAALWRGFLAWCQDVGHDAWQVLRLGPLGPDGRDPAFFLIHEQIEHIERRAEDAQAPFPDPEKVKMWRDTFASAFGLVDDESDY
jgi:hypothetical protein